AGALSLEERLEVERLAADSPDVLAALQDACDVVEQYAAIHAVQPPPALKEKVLGQIMRDHPSASEYPVEENAVRPLYPDEEQDNGPYKWMFAASIALFLLSGFMSFRFYQNWKDAEARLEQVLASEQTLAQNYQTASYQL